MLLQALLAAALLLLAWWLLTDPDQFPEGEGAAREAATDLAAPLRPGVPVIRPAPGQAPTRPDQEYPARVG
jgi:hypothetical protein